MHPISFFDAHCDTVSCCAHLGWDLADSPGHTDLRRGARFAQYAQVFALYHDSAEPPLDGMFAECVRQIETFQTQLARYPEQIVQCRTAEELERAEKSHQIAALLSVEGADLLECDPERLNFAKQMGVKLINLTWNRANALSGTNVEEPDRGLGEQGRAFVRRAQRLDILMDVSHLSDRGFWDLMEITEKPIVASHSDSRVLCGHPRNLTDEMFCAIRDSGGFVGLNFYLPFLGMDGSIDAIFAHLEHFLALGGERTVGFGCDWDGCDAMPAPIRGVQDMELIYEEMIRRGYGQELIDGIFYNNLKHTIFEG